MSLVEHLRELRNRLAVSLVAIAVGVVVAWFFFSPIYAFLRAPYCRIPSVNGCNLYALDIFAQFRVRLRVSFLAGTVATAPVWLYELGAFITPALHRKERRFALVFLAASLTLFAAGATFAYLTVSRGLEFFLSVGGDGIVTLLSISSYLSFVTLMLLAFGIAFEFPVVLMFLNVVGVMPAARMRAWWRGMVFGIFVASAVITPTQDPFSFLAMALPLCLLYGLCIWLSALRERRKRRREAADPLHRLDDDETSEVDSEPSRL
jgi:sec-independent protein translocase protein TatC